MADLPDEEEQAAAAPANLNKQQKQAAKKQQQQEQKEAGRQARQQKNLTFTSYDRQVLEQLPFIREQVPFLTTAKGAIDTSLLQLLKLLAVSDVGFANLVNRLQELHHWQYYKQMLIYYSFAAAVKKVHEARVGECHNPVLPYGAI